MRLLVALLIAVICIHYTRFYQGRDWAWLFVVAWIPIGLYVIWAGLGLVYRLDRLPFHRLELGLEEDQVAPGGSFVVGVRILPRRGAHLEEAAVSLVCEQKKLVDGQRETRTLHSIDVPVLKDEPLVPDGRVERTISVPLPGNAPYSFRSMDARIAWTLSLRVQVSEWGRLEESVGVVVGPV